MPKHAKIASTLSPRKYGDADGYDSYMGRWSAGLAPLFLEFASVGRPASLLDVGSGTGNLLAAAAVALPDTRLVGIDPSETLLLKARTRPELARVEFIEGGADALPFAVETFDCCLSLLVLQEFSDRLAALRAMRRVTRSGGIVSACVWDFTRMPIIAALVEAIATVDPVAGANLATNSPRLIADELELSQNWIEAGFKEVSADRISIVCHFRDFNDLWRPLLAGSTPSTLTLAALPRAARNIVHSLMSKRFDGKQGGFSVLSEALVVRGKA
jgi:ubiquinone/menaquinone biosynthesis C-methylase UbiE